MEVLEYDDIIGNYAIKGKILTVETIAKQFYFASIVPHPLLNKEGKPVYNEEMENECFATARLIKEAHGGIIVNAFVIAIARQGSDDLKLIPHGIVIKDSQIIDPISQYKYPNGEMAYLIPKKIRKSSQVEHIIGNFITLSKEGLNTLFPTYIKTIQ